jgi:uncharacterized protein YbbC (DUF1343 family)/CubicO group peptidase (beta-lactamase class C family)
MKTLAILCCAAACLEAQAPFSGAAAVDEQIEQAVRSGLIPGAVLVVGHDGAVTYRKAYGQRVLIPKPEPMTVDTIFDAASLTKVIATTPSLMKLFEQGKIRIDDPVIRYLPEFQGGKSDIEIRDLMTHFSGLRPDLDLKPAWSGYQTGIQRALIDKPVRPPGLRFVYSDINFILLGEIVHRLSGQMLSDFAKENIFQPLGMQDSMFQPPASLIPRIAPTEIDPDTGKPLRGVVHDDTSRYMGGVAGHAGLFTTADDLAKFAQMMLDRGVAGQTRLFQASSVEKFTSPASPADQPILRGLGWDIDSPYSSNRGELFPIGSYGHTGFTGTSVWIDPTSKTYVILLTNVVHPHRGKSLTSFRSKVATIVAASYGILTPGVRLTGYNETITGPGLHRAVDHQGATLTGLDVLVAENFAPLQGKRIGLITNQTGLSRDARRNVDLMLAAGVKVTALFSPEHGLNGTEDQPDVANSKDPATGLPVISLYHGDARKVTPALFNGLDALVYDIQDVGVRFHTYSCTMLSAMEGAAAKHVSFYVLDRPNPITGVHIEGPILDKDLESSVGCMEIPLRHGMTTGELATWANGERNIGADLHVIAMQGWNRGDWLDATGLAWVNPSPNLRSLNAELLYPGLAMLEASTNYSVGRGTDAPFEQIGADWIHGRALAAFLNGRYIPGVRAYPTRFTPTASNFAGRSIEGVRFTITDRDAFDSTRLGLEMAYALEKLFPGNIRWDVDRFLISNHQIVAAMKAGTDPRTVVQELEEALAGFVARREKYLIYK